MRPNVVSIVPMIPALCVRDVFAEQERRGGLEEPHVLLDEMDDDRAANTAVFIAPPPALTVLPRQIWGLRTICRMNKTDQVANCRQPRQRSVNGDR